VVEDERPALLSLNLHARHEREAAELLGIPSNARLSGDEPDRVPSLGACGQGTDLALNDIGSPSPQLTMR
jgi:hypothetical protein